MPVYCYGDGCPLRAGCYRHTQPAPGRDRFAALPYDALSGTCAEHITNIPTAEHVREAAYHLWLRRGRPEGQAEAHWREAYAALCLSMGRDPDAPPPACSICDN
jgi:hypothetical protein